MDVGGPGRALVAHQQSNSRISRGAESTLKIRFGPSPAPARHRTLQVLHSSGTGGPGFNRQDPVIHRRLHGTDDSQPISWYYFHLLSMPCSLTPESMYRCLVVLQGTGFGGKPPRGFRKLSNSETLNGHRCFLPQLVPRTAWRVPCSTRGLSPTPVIEQSAGTTTQNAETYRLPGPH